MTAALWTTVSAGGRAVARSASACTWEVAVRPVLKSGLRLLWRDAATVQLGVDARHAVVLERLDPSVTATLELLDGTRTLDEVVAAAARVGLAAADTTALLALLRRNGALDDATAPPPGLPAAERDRLAPDVAGLGLVHREPGAGVAALRRRRGAAVLVLGTGRIGSAAASLLAAAGVGTLLLRDDADATRADALPGGLRATDAGRPRVVAAAEAATSAGQVHVDAAVRAADGSDCAVADAALIAPAAGGVPGRAALELLAATQLPHLLATVRETCGTVGPFVVPGRTSCPRCHDLHRAERDRDWPAVAAQLAVPSRGDVAAGESALCAAVAAWRRASCSPGSTRPARRSRSTPRSRFGCRSGPCGAAPGGPTRAAAACASPR